MEVSRDFLIKPIKQICYRRLESWLEAHKHEAVPNLHFERLKPPFLGIKYRESTRFGYTTQTTI